MAEIVFDEERMTSAQEMMEEIKNDLYDIDCQLYDAVMKIAYAPGIEYVENDNEEIDMRMPEQQMIDCRNTTNSISDAIKGQFQLYKEFMGSNSTDIAPRLTENIKELRKQAQILYGPPPTSEPQQILYGPPPESEPQQILYGPPPESEPQQILYGPPQREPIQELYGVPTPNTGSMQELYGVPTPNTGSMQELYGVPTPNTGSMQELYGVPTPNTGSMQELYGVPTPNTGPMQAVYGVPTPDTGPMQAVYGVPTPNTGPMQAVYGVPTPDTGPMQAVYGVPTPNQDPVYEEPIGTNEPQKRVTMDPGEVVAEIVDIPQTAAMETPQNTTISETPQMNNSQYESIPHTGINQEKNSKNGYISAAGIGGAIGLAGMAAARKQKKEEEETDEENENRI